MSKTGIYRVSAMHANSLRIDRSQYVIDSIANGEYPIHMRKPSFSFRPILILCCATAIAIFAPKARCQDTTFFRHIDAAKDKVFRVESSDSTFLGTAFSISSNGFPLTCEHVVRSMDTIFLSNYVDMSIEGQADSITHKRRVRFVASVDTVLPKLDLAVLKIELDEHDLVRTPFFVLRNREMSERVKASLSVRSLRTFSRLPCLLSQRELSVLSERVYTPAA